jgi:hypothetical protein
MSLSVDSPAMDLTRAQPARQRGHV